MGEDMTFTLYSLNTVSFVLPYKALRREYGEFDWHTFYLHT